MANQTTLLRQGTGATICIDSEPTANGQYPVSGKGVYEAINTAISQLSGGVRLKGSVATYAELPATAVAGDAYTVANENNCEYVKTAESWVKLGADIGQGVSVDDATSETLLTQFNALLASLRAANVIASPPVEETPEDDTPAE